MAFLPLRADRSREGKSG